MVLGMSGRNGEHRRGNTQPRKERDRERDKERTDSSQPTLPSQKHKVSLSHDQSHDNNASKI